MAQLKSPAVAVLVTSLSVLALITSEARPGPCIGSLTEDFNGGAVSSIWDLTATNCGTVAVTGGVLEMDNPGCVGSEDFVMDGSQAVVCGDFDVSVDFNLVTFPTPLTGHRVAQLVAQDVAGNSVAVIERYAAPPGTCNHTEQLYKAFTTNSDDCSASLSGPGDGAGSFRITRQDQTLRMYYWNILLGGWTLLRQEDVTRADVCIALATGSSDDPTFASQVQFDNLRISSALPSKALYLADSNALPSDICPVWGLFNTSSTPPQVSGGLLTLTTNANGENQYFLRQQPDLVFGDSLVVDFQTQLLSGNSSSSIRAPIALQLQMSPYVGNTLFIGTNELFLLASPSARGMTANVATTDTLHTYRAIIAGANVSVYYDGELVLTGQTYQDANAWPRGAIIWGEASGAAMGRSAWRYFQDNASEAPCQYVLGVPGVKVPPLGAASAVDVNPNPAVGGAYVRWAMSHSGEIVLDVVDVRGRRVDTLLRGESPAGEHMVRWDERSADGERVRPGVYFVRLSVDGIQRPRTTRVVVVK